jgi:hypothetical protein
LLFADALDGISPEWPFANLLTATKLSFCNMLHCDKDSTPVANVDHDKTSGGEFMWGAYGIGVDFAKFSSFVLFSGECSFHLFTEHVGLWRYSGMVNSIIMGH